MSSSPDEVFEKKRGPVRKAWDNAKALIQFLKNRRSARAVAAGIANNQVAVAALAASVAAAGIGGYGVVQAQRADEHAGQANERVADLQQRVASVEASIIETQASVAGLEADVEDLSAATAARLRSIGLRSDVVADRLTALAGQVSTLPSERPETGALARQIADAAHAARLAMKKAERAALAAAEEPRDELARQAAAQAATDAAVAGAQAAEAQRAADEAANKADAAQAEAEKHYDPIPRTIEIPDDTRTNNANPYARNFTVDLPPGDFTATLTGTVIHTANGHWTAKLNSAARSGTGNGQFAIHVNFHSTGGTLAFSTWFDGDVVGPGNITFQDVTVTINYQEALAP